MNAPFEKPKNTLEYYTLDDFGEPGKGHDVCLSNAHFHGSEEDSKTLYGRGHAEMVAEKLRGLAVLGELATNLKVVAFAVNAVIHKAVSIEVRTLESEEKARAQSVLELTFHQWRELYGESCTEKRASNDLEGAPVATVATDRGVISAHVVIPPPHVHAPKDSGLPPVIYVLMPSGDIIKFLVKFNDTEGGRLQFHLDVDSYNVYMTPVHKM